jgi:hypothetical protein
MQATNAYAVAKPADVPSMQKEIMAHGSIEVGFQVFEDFMSYHNGTYARTAGAAGPKGGHAVKVSEKNSLFFAPSYSTTKTRTFAKTGSGETQRKHSKKDVFSQLVGWGVDALGVDYWCVHVHHSHTCQQPRGSTTHFPL